jgi:hypothetical protein
MKAKYFFGLCLLCAGLMFVACQKDELVKTIGDDIVAVRAVSCGSVVVTAPTQVCVGEEFTISVVSAPSCGRVRLQQEDTNSDCNADESAWGPLVANTCHNAGFPSWTGSKAVAGTYTYRSVHNAGGAGPCGGTNCSFSGNNFCCFTVTVVDCGCEYDGNSFSGAAGAGSCDDTRSATYTFSSEDGEDYIKIQGGLNNFTSENATVTVTGGTLINQDQWTPGMSSNRIILVEASLDECEALTVHIEWNSSNGDSEITGTWSAKDENGVDLAPAVTDLSCN